MTMGDRVDTGSGVPIATSAAETAAELAQAVRDATRDLAVRRGTGLVPGRSRGPRRRRREARMIASELLAWSLAELVARLRSGDVSSREATEAVLAALDGPGRSLGAVARLYPEAALAAADAADTARARGDLLGPLHGVPLAHKDMFYRSGQLAECGATLMRGHRPTVTATVLARLDAAGAIDVGRLNMVEFALGITGHNAHTGHPRNPWDTSRITGGSTSGGAAAVAARLLPATLGSDTGGSIRYPAACCGLVGLKPTYGRVSRVRLHAAVVLARPCRPAGPLGRGCGPGHAGDRRRRSRRPDHRGATGAGLRGHDAPRRRRPSAGGGGSRPRQRGRR